MPNAIVTIRWNFVYGALGTASANVHDTPQFGRSLKQLINGIPSASGSLAKREAIQNITFSAFVQFRLSNFFAGCNDPDPYRFLLLAVHDPTPYQVVPILIIANWASGIASYTGEYLILADQFQHTINPINISPESLQRADINQGGLCMTITDYDYAQSFFQILTGSGSTYRLILQEILLKGGPCGSQRSGKDIDRWKWTSEDPASTELLGGWLRPGARILIKFADRSILTTDMIGGIFAFNNRVDFYNQFLAPATYSIGHLIHHGDNLYYLIGPSAGYSPKENAKAPEHNEPGEIGRYAAGDPSNVSAVHGQWLYVNSGVGYAKFIQLLAPDSNGVPIGLFEVQWGLSPAAKAEKLMWDSADYPPAGDSWNPPLACPRYGWARRLEWAFNRLLYSWGRPLYTDVRGIEPKLVPDIESTGVISGSVTGDYEDLNLIGDPLTSAIEFLAASRGGSIVLSMCELDSRRLAIQYMDGTSVLRQTDDGQIILVGAAQHDPALSPDTCIMSNYICCVSVNRRNITGLVYNQITDSWPDRELLLPDSDMLHGTSIKHIYSIKRSPGTLLVQKDNGELAIAYIADDDGRVGFWEVTCGFEIIDVDYARDTKGRIIYTLVKDPSLPERVRLGIFSLDWPTNNSLFLDWGTRPIEFYASVGEMYLPTNIGQGTWTTASMLISVKVRKQVGRLTVNGYDANSPYIDIVLLNEDVENLEETIILRDNSNGPLIITNLEIEAVIPEAK